MKMKHCIRNQGAMASALFLLLAAPVSAQKISHKTLQAAELLFPKRAPFSSAIQGKLPAPNVPQLQRRIHAALQQKAALRIPTGPILLNRADIVDSADEKHFQPAPGYPASPGLLSDHTKVLRQIQQLLEQDPRLLSHAVFLNHYLPVTVPSAFAVKNNQMVLKATKYLLEKIQWLEKRPKQGRPQLQSLTGPDAVLQLAEKLSGEKLILLGEMHYVKSIQNAVQDLVLELHRLQPERRIVVFTEFVDLPEHTAAPSATLDTYFRNLADEPLEKLGDEDLYLRVEYAQPLLAALVRNGVEVYALEDRTLCDLIRREESPLPSEKNTARAIMYRNQTWARVMQRKMAEIRRTDPDALFIVYAGMGHTSWLVPYSMPKFFTKEKPAVVEISPLVPSRMNALAVTWGDRDPYFTPRKETALYYWSGPEARVFGQKTGFDYALILAGRNLRWSADGL